MGNVPLCQSLIRSLPECAVHTGVRAEYSQSQYSSVVSQTRHPRKIRPASLSASVSASLSVIQQPSLRPINN